MASLLPWTDREKLSKGSSHLNAGADQYLNGILQYHYGMHNQNPAAYNAGAIAANVGEMYVCNRVTDQISGVAENGATGACQGGKGSSFASDEKLLSHYDKHGNEFKGVYNSAEEYLQGARDVMNNGYKVEYAYKGETRTGYVQFMGNNSKGKAKFAFVGTNNDGFITTFHTESDKTFWKLLNGENIPIINPK